MGLDIKGRHGQTLSHQWKEQGGPQAYLGTTVAGFPNFLSLLGPNSASGHASVIHSHESQIHYIIEMIRPMIEHGVKSFEVKLDADTRYNRQIQKKLENTVWQGGCNSWYK